MTKIVVIGAGSASFGCSVFRDVFMCPDLKGSILSLVDLDEKSLDRMYDFACAINEKTDMNIKIEKHLERKAALKDAQFVITCIAIQRNKLWALDFQIPKKHGVRHCLGENGGPGALFFTLRTIPMIIDICRDMEKLCPDAYLLNFSNPESRIVQAVSRYTKIKCIGLCHGIFGPHQHVSDICGMPKDEVEILGAGMNHFQWLLNINSKKDGRDLYPLLRENEKNYDPTFEPLTRKVFRTFGYWPTCSDDHMGEYLSWGYEAGEEGPRFEGDEEHRKYAIKEIEDLTAGNIDLNGWLIPSGEVEVEVIAAIITGKRRFIPAAIVLNENAITNLPGDVAVEIPILVDGGGIHKVHIGDMPNGPRALLSAQIGPQILSVDAAMRGSKEIALQALLCDPVINSSDIAVKVLDELWEINKQYIRNCLN